MIALRRTVRGSVIDRSIAILRRVLPRSVLRTLVGVEGRLFDGFFGTDTRGVLFESELGVEGDSSRDGFEYIASPVWRTLRALRMLPIRHQEFTFVDYGSGKGRVLLLAALFPFKEILGVEYSSRVHEVAERNIRHFTARRPASPPIRAVRVDATEFDLPMTPLVLYFYLPFKGAVREAVEARIRNNVERSPRPVVSLHLFYANPPDFGPRFVKVPRYRAHGGWGFEVYTTVPELF